MLHFMASLPKGVLPPPMKICSHTFKMAIFPKFFDDLISNIIREYAGEKNEIISEYFTINNHGFSFVSFSTDQTLVINHHLLKFDSQEFEANFSLLVLI